VTFDEYYDLEDQLAVLRGHVNDLTHQVDRIREDVRMLRYDLDVLQSHRP